MDSLLENNPKQQHDREKRMCVTKLNGGFKKKVGKTFKNEVGSLKNKPQTQPIDSHPILPPSSLFLFPSFLFSSALSHFPSLSCETWSKFSPSSVEMRVWMVCVFLASFIYCSQMQNPKRKGLSANSKGGTFTL